jgi:hypothetical protein
MNNGMTKLLSGTVDENGAPIRCGGATDGCEEIQSNPSAGKADDGSMPGHSARMLFGLILYDVGM